MADQSLLARGPPVDGIGAWAGGPDTLSKLISALPVDGGVAWLIVQHIDPTLKNMVAELFAKHIGVRLVMHDDQELLLVGFVDPSGQPNRPDAAAIVEGGPRVADLEHELEWSRADLAAAIRHLELSSKEHRAAKEEALSLNEQYQSVNEELLASKQDLQSLNEELVARNAQLQETLECQRTTSNNLQNVLYSTDVATLFLDPELKIRFFTPATKALFNLIPGDIGRPLSDLNALAADPMLADDARAVLQDRKAHDCEIEVPGDRWYMRHILPYRTDADGVEGVAISRARNGAAILSESCAKLTMALELRNGVHFGVINDEMGLYWNYYDRTREG